MTSIHSRAVASVTGAARGTGAADRALELAELADAVGRLCPAGASAVSGAAISVDGAFNG